MALSLVFLIIDEASMIDIFLAHSVMRALPNHAQIVLLGDIDQLPSVGAGNFLHDLIASNVAPCVRLTHIFRQAQESLIVTNAHRINNGEFPLSSSMHHKQDYIFIKEDDPAVLPAQLRKIYMHTLQRYNIQCANAMTLVPMKRGIAGTQTLNHVLQDILNPSTTGTSLQREETTFKTGDRVMQIRNNYHKFVFNGDIGYIEHIDIAGQSLLVKFPDREVLYEMADLDEIVLAYAISVHKSQGSEIDAVIVPLFTQHFALLQRNLLYTAITRAKKLCIFIGQAKALAIAVKNNTHRGRCTFLKKLLVGTVLCR
jgi:exodeoxyribonuclease V alpha subunit